MRAVPVLLLCVLLAGCGDAPAPSDDHDLQSDPGPDPDVAPPGEAVLFEQVVWEGRTKEGFFVCDGPDGTGACPAGQQFQPDGEHATVIPYNGTLTEAAVTLEWTPSDPTQTGLVLVAYGPGGRLNLTRGDGDLHTRIDAPDLPPDGNLTLIVWPEGKTETNPSLFLDVTRQSFRVTVDLVTTVPAAPDGDA